MVWAGRTVLGLALAGAVVTLAWWLAPFAFDRAVARLGINPSLPDKVFGRLGFPRPEFTLDQRLELIGPAARARMAAALAKAGVAYPPAAVTLVGLKSEKVLQLYAKAGEPGAGWQFVRSFPVLAASGHPGPKLKEGDRQVPEGVYGIDFLNPNSLYNVSMRVTYPNDFDRARASEEHRDNLGGAIMIHGRAASIGCLAMGDLASEERFMLAAAVGLANITVILAPVDLRTQPRPSPDGAPNWLPDLYDRIGAALNVLPVSAGSAS